MSAAAASRGGQGWWWVRHAPTHVRAAVGWTDAPADLSDAAALDRLAAALPAAPVVSSDLARAVATARRIAGARPLQAADARLRELNFGAWEGMTYDAAAAAQPDAYRAFFETPGPSRAPGGESFDDLRARVCDAIEARKADGGDVVLVAHAGAIRAALAVALDLTPAQALGFAVDPLSITRLDWIASAGAWRVVCVNTRA
ncbi:histidine phosphatase family protein [Rubrimonas cliftonensis]|uniref:Broad specificity phosphatase PhoE n=1 Tax=Rubrimonas cliftonensis TaxID=89524 RepID=A0A1H4ALA5_9RHOB|nr:histidine phosphatase family protein [Rubrimonas cliftonensis]SEA36700.1 Broad specificity phosphatase PhoE [Rubrimonas cliftonensis]